MVGARRSSVSTPTNRRDASRRYVVSSAGGSDTPSGPVWRGGRHAVRPAGVGRSRSVGVWRPDGTGEDEDQRGRAMDAFSRASLEFEREDDNHTWMDDSYVNKLPRRPEGGVDLQDLAECDEGNEQRVLVLFTGGTIGMVRNADNGQWRTTAPAGPRVAQPSL